MSAPGLKITNFYYSHMTFPQGPGTEYPKWIHMSGYPSEIAPDAEAEACLLGRPSKTGDVAIKLEPAKADAIAQPMAETDERAALIQVAKEKNIKIDGRWSIERLRETIEKAGP